MALRRAFKVSTILIISLLFLSGVFYLLDVLGVFSVAGTLARVPVVGKLAEKKDKVATKSTDELIREAVEAAKKEAAQNTDRYKKKVSELDQQLARTSKEKQLLEQEQLKLQTDVETLQAWKSQQQQAAKTDYPKLAQYYAGMKPAVAVKIMDNLTDEINIGILQNMTEDEVAQILSAMDPKMAARLVAQMNGQKNSAR